MNEFCCRVRASWARNALILLAFAGVGLAGVPPRRAAAQTPSTPPAPISHVFIIVLENNGYDTTFGPASRAPYLADSLPAKGALLRQYYGIGHVSLDNYIAMISGMPPTRQTQVDCPRYDDFVETGIAPDGQPIGTGCIYPAHVQTIANQLAAKGLTWKAYLEDMGRDPTRESSTCGRGTMNVIDPTEHATPKDQYAAKHNPFVYFHAIVDSASCNANDVELRQLEHDLKSQKSTANYSFIVPNLCHDAHDRPCKNGEPGGLVSANLFLEHWVPMITSSSAFKHGGLLIITFDEALSIDATACCDEPTGPNTLRPGVNGPGGGRIGAVLLSPYIKGGTISDQPYNHYSMLRSVEDLFGLPHLGYAGAPGLRPFGADVFTQPDRH